MRLKTVVVELAIVGTVLATIAAGGCLVQDARHGARLWEWCLAAAALLCGLYSGWMWFRVFAIDRKYFSSKLANDIHKQFTAAFGWLPRLAPRRAKTDTVFPTNTKTSTCKTISDTASRK